MAKSKSISRAAERAVFERFNHECNICGREIEFYDGEVDHIIPLSKDGTNNLENLQWLCGMCNKLKGNTRTNEEVKKIVKEVVKKKSKKAGKIDYSKVKIYKVND